MGFINSSFKLLICTDFAELLTNAKTLAPFTVRGQKQALQSHSLDLS